MRGVRSRMQHQALTRRDLQAVLDATRACSEADNLCGFADAVVGELPRLVGCDVASYDEIELSAGGGFGRTNPLDLYGSDSRRLSESYDVLSAFGDEHPLIPLATSRPELFPLAWSDLRSKAEIHAMNLYDLLYRHTGQEDQLAAVLHGSPEKVVGITVDRDRRGFSARDRAVLEAFARQLEGVRRLVDENERLSGLVTAASIGEPVWRITLLGGYSLSGPSGPLPVEGRSAALVKSLALAGGPVVLDQLFERLWPEAEFAVARKRLRVLLHRLPRGPSPLIVRRGEALQLGPSVSVDAADFEERARRALDAARTGAPEAKRLCEAALAAYRSDLLPEDTYEDWTAARRERLRRRRLALMDALAREAERAGDPTGALLLLADAVETDPLDEARQLRLGWLYAATGRRAAAFGVFEAARRTSANLGLALAPGWRQLLDALRDGGENARS